MGKKFVLLEDGKFAFANENQNPNVVLRLDEGESFGIINYKCKGKPIKRAFVTYDNARNEQHLDSTLTAFAVYECVDKSDCWLNVEIVSIKEFCGDYFLITENVFDYKRQSTVEKTKELLARYGVTPSDDEIERIVKEYNDSCKF